MANIAVEVAYALPERQYLFPLSLPEGCTVREAIERAGILQIRKEIDLDRHRVGIYGRLAKLDDMLQAGDRVEIYRPLLIDPKEWRRQRANREKPGMA